jgi:hypothetical protein
LLPTDKALKYPLQNANKNNKMNVREHFNQLFKEQKMPVRQVRAELDKCEQYERMKMPEGVKVARMVSWCIENLGYESFVICQDMVYFDDSVQAVKFKLMCNLDKLKEHVKKRWY